MEYKTRNVLADPELRSAIKDYRYTVTASKHQNIEIGLSNFYKEPVALTLQKFEMNTFKGTADVQ